MSAYGIAAPSFFNDTATTEIYTLSLHDALPICKSTVHKDITDADRLLRIDPELAAKARHILDINKSERHIRGGLATREKYLHLPHVHAG